MSTEVFQAVGGLDLFLVGMTMLMEGLRSLSGDRLRRTLRQSTDSPLKGALAGALTNLKQRFLPTASRLTLWQQGAIVRRLHVSIHGTPPLVLPSTAHCRLSRLRRSSMHGRLANACGPAWYDNPASGLDNGANKKIL